MITMATESPKENTNEQRKQDLDLLGDILGPISQSQSATNRLDALDILSMGGTSEERRAAREHKEQQEILDKQEEAAKRKENIDKKENAIKEAQEKAANDVQTIFGGNTEDVLSSIGDTVKGAILEKDADVENVVTTYHKAEKEVKKVMGQVQKVQSYLKDPEKALKEIGLKVLSNEGLLKLQQGILSNKLAESLTFDNIVAKVAEYWTSAQGSFATLTEKLAAKKAYISAFIKNTFGNPEYMKTLTENITNKIDTALKNLACKKIDGFIGKIDDKINSVFSRVDAKLDQITSQVYAKIDSLTKLDCLKDINNKLQGVLSMESLTKKLESTPFGKLISSPIGKIAKSAGGKIIEMFKSSKYAKVFEKVTGAFQRISQSIQKAKDFVKQKVQMIKDYVNKLKDMAVNAIKEYATKIVSDIASKIAVSAGNAISGALGSIGG